IERALLCAPTEWRPRLAQHAEDQGYALLSEVGVTLKGRAVLREVEVEVGPPMRFPSKLVLPLRWAATGGQGLFPTLDADLEVGALGPERTDVSMRASYVPPFGLPGRVLDRILLHRVAEATVKDFVDHVAELLLDRESV